MARSELGWWSRHFRVDQTFDRSCFELIRAQWLRALENRIFRGFRNSGSNQSDKIQFTVRALNRERARGIVRVLVSPSKNVAREYIKRLPSWLHDSFAIDQIAVIINLSACLEVRTCFGQKEIKPFWLVLLQIATHSSIACSKTKLFRQELGYITTNQIGQWLQCNPISVMVVLY